MNSTTQRQPLVSIGMPVYNGSQYLDAAMSSLLSQEFENFELLVSDNASTDATQEICQIYAASDRRVRYERQPENRGAVWNFNRVFHLASGEYFLWAAHDDIWAPTFLSRCVEQLEADPEAGLCVTDIAFIDQTGLPIPEGPWLHNQKPVGKSSWQRLSVFARSPGWFTIYGLMRRSVLQQTRLLRSVFGSDVVLSLEMCLRAGVASVPEKLFSSRVLPKPPASVLASLVGQRETLHGHWSGFAIEMLGGINSVPSPFAERATLSARFLYELCVRNSFMRTAIRRDVFRAAHAAYRARRYARTAEILSLALVVYPASVAAVMRRLAASLVRGQGS